MLLWTVVVMDEIIFRNSSRVLCLVGLGHCGRAEGFINEKMCYKLQ